MSDDSIFEEYQPPAKPAAPAPAPVPAPKQATPAMAAEFEDGAQPVSPTAPAAAAAAATAPVAADLQAACDHAASLVAGAMAQRRQVDLWALGLAALCGHGLGALTRIEHWSGGVGLCFLFVLGGILLSAWWWTLARRPAVELETLPVPNPGTLRSKPMDAEQLAAAQRRMQEDIAAIDLCAGLLEALRLRLRWAVLAASLGAVCGWIAGSFGQPGAALLAGSAGAIAAAVGGWCWRAQGWDQRRVRIHVVGIVPGACLVVAWLAGTHILWAIGGAGLAAGGSWIALRRLPLERGLEADPGTPA